MSLLQYLQSTECAPTIPVIALDDLATAVPLARACAAGGVRILEVTLRTAAGVQAIEAIARQVPDVLVGAGTVTRVDELARVRDAGARFAFAPGFDARLVQAAGDMGLEFIPAVMTPSEVMAGQNLGVGMMKLFPAAQAGGPGMLKALAGPFPAARFCPTGGVDAANASTYLGLPNVVAVGGSWMTPKDLIQRGDWAGITALCTAALKLRKARGA